jgi:acetyl-CoA acetyltransferase family protein
MSEPFVHQALRTAVGTHGGALASVRPDDLAAVPLQAVVERSGVDPAAIDDVIFGCANQAGEDNRNVARMALLLAGLPVEIPGQTVNRLCASGLQAVASAAQAIRAGEGSLFLAGGVESMTRAPYVLRKSAKPWSRTPPDLADTTVGWRFTNPRLRPEWTISLGETAEEVAVLHGITREDQDAFALESQARAARAIESGVFDDEIVPVFVEQRKGDPIRFDRDEHPRPGVTGDSLARLRSPFRKGGSVTAGSSSGINDGAAALLIAAEGSELGRSLGPPLARIVSSAVAGVDPSVMGLGPIPAVQKVLERTGLRIDQIGLVELNEAFAAQSIACIRELKLDPKRVNLYGGAIALGHPSVVRPGLARLPPRHGLGTSCNRVRRRSTSCSVL